MYAIIETGSKQYKVSEGDIIKVEKLNINPGENCELTDVVFLSNGEQNSFGTPNLKNISITANVIRHGKNKKVIIYKYKPKKGFHKKKGHRQPFTELKVIKINVND